MIKQERKLKEEREKQLEYEAYLASKKNEEEEELALNTETEHQLEASKAALMATSSDVNSAVINLLENYNGIGLNIFNFNY